jgi:hypothetical protein
MEERLNPIPPPSTPATALHQQHNMSAATKVFRAQKVGRHRTGKKPLLA